MASRLILDSGAILAFARGDSHVRAVLRTAWKEGDHVVVPAVVVAQVIRGDPRDAPVHRVLNVAHVSFVGKRLARVAGELLGAAGSSDAVDALVVAEALRAGPSVVLTSDPNDLTRLAGGRPQVTIRPV